MKTKKRFLGILLSLALVLGLMPGMRLTAKAESAPVTYLDASGNALTCETYTVVADSTTTWGAGWYVVNSNVTINSKATFSGDVNIILCDNATLTFNPPNNSAYTGSGSLTIYAQSTGNSMGELVASSNNNYTIINNSGNITINGGKVTATASGNDSTCRAVAAWGNVTINGGIINATGYQNGIYASYGNNVEINGGTVTAQATNYCAIGGTVKNKIAGVGWTDESGSGDGTTIAVSEAGQTLYSYMRVQFGAPAHTHSFTYSADGATITATCGAEGCDLTSNPTLTIVAPTLTTYGQTGEGISEKATLDGLDAFNSATDLTVAASDIKYYGVEEYEIEGHTYKKQGDELAQVPTAAGEYVAGLTLSNVKTSETETGDVIARVWYTIAPASISSVTVTDITAPVATEALDTEAATSTANVTLGAVTWNPTTTPAAYATQYTATVIATAAANYAFADTVTATVNGQAATVTKNDGGTLTIAYTFEKTALTPVTITATDKKADWSADGIAIPVEGMFTITEGAGAATYTVTNGTGEGTYDAQTGKLTVTKCGTFTVKVSTAATDTYAAGAETTATLTVNKADSTAATVTANTLTYTGSAQALVTVIGEATGGTMQYALGTKDAATEEYTPSIPTGTNAGTYYVWYKVVGDANHNDTKAASVKVSIAKRSVTLTSATGTKVYDASALTDATVTVTGDGFATGEGAAYDVTGSQTLAGESKNTFTYTLNNGTKADNYEITKIEGTLTVEKAESSGKVTAISGLVYDGVEKALVNSEVHGGIFMYRLGTDGEWTEDIPEAVAFDTYTVYYYIEGDGNHKDNGSKTEPMGSVDVTIKCPYSKEWVDGKWYNKDGSQTYKPLGSWKKDGKDWMYADSSGWYAKNRWQKIDFKWYFFDKEGHMLKDAYQKDASGKIWYLGKNGVWDEKAAVIGWKQDSKGWWFGLYGKEYLKSTWKMINGNWYYFKSDGYIAMNEFVQGWWLNKTGAWKDPIQCSWHKAGSKWWYGTKDGWYAKGRSYTIDGKKYTFDEKGYTK